MKKSLTYKQKNKLMLIGLLPLAFLVYSFALKKSFSLVSQVREMEERISEANDAPMRSALLKSEIGKLELSLASFNKQETKTEEALLEAVTNYCKANETVLREFPEMTKEERGNYSVETNRFMVQGSFSQLLSLVYFLEQKNSFGNIASVDYGLKKDPKTKEAILVATIFLQNIKKK